MTDSTLTDSLKKYFSHDSFRKPQDDIIASILSGKDTLAIMPTGGGKSLCYQLPAVMLDGVTIVVSPLIALMKDQVDALQQKGIAAVMINSSQTWEAQSQALDMLANGELKLAYVAPERFRAMSFMRALRNVKISLFAIDEAHCISQWGHDFRPDYMKLGETIEKLGRPRCAAFTATATPEVKRDILTQLNLKEPNVFVSGFARPNLSFNVREVSTKAEKISRIKELIEEYQTGIIYCATRKSVDALSEALWKDGLRHIIYHGAMSPSERDKAQETFISKKENIAIATNAFGMGIDRADIRFVCHYELTGSIEALYQESGRAGRDGQPSYCEMLLMYADKRVQEFFIEGANPDLDFIRTAYRVIKENSGNSHECVMPIDAMAEEIADIVKFERKLNTNRFSKPAKSSSATNSMAVSSSISILRKYGYIDRFDVPGSRARGTRLLDPDIEHYQISFPIGMIEEKRNRDETKLRDVIRYAYSKECRQQWILNYFGDDKNQPCNNCDICKTSPDLLKDVEYLTDEERTILIKALSAVARMSVKIAPRIWQPRFGRDKIIKCMCGSKDEKILSSGLDKLTTYGILKDHGTKFCTKLLSAAIDAGFVETVDGIYPLTGLTERGVRIMLGEDTNIKFRFPKDESKILKPKKSAKKPNQPPEDLSDEDYTLYNALVRLRARICMQRGGIPSYLIFSNDVLIQMAKNKPKSMEEGMQIKGIGAINSKKYLKQFIEVLKKY